MNRFFEDKSIVVTGGAGFLGAEVVRRLKSLGCRRIVVPRSREFDLTQEASIRSLLERTKPDLVLHLAAVVGGIGANRVHPGEFFYKNLIMGVQLIEMSRQYSVSKFVAIGTICAYPKFTPVPFSEEDLWRAISGISTGIWLQFNFPSSGESLRAGRQFRPGNLARHSSVDS